MSDDQTIDPVVTPVAPAPEAPEVETPDVAPEAVPTEPEANPAA